MLRKSIAASIAIAIATALAAATALTASAAPEGKDDSAPHYPSDEKIHGVSALEINGDNDSITLTQGKQSAQDVDYNLKSGSGAKKRTLTVKVGEEFQVEMKDFCKRTYHLDKISDGYAYLTCTVKYNKKNADCDSTYRCKVRSFGGK